MTITAEQIKEAQRAGYDVTIIINGEFYELETETDTAPEK